MFQRNDCLYRMVYHHAHRCRLSDCIWLFDRLMVCTGDRQFLCHCLARSSRSTRDHSRPGHCTADAADDRYACAHAGVHGRLHCRMALRQGASLHTYRRAWPMQQSGSTARRPTLPLFHPRATAILRGPFALVLGCVYGAIKLLATRAHRLHHFHTVFLIVFNLSCLIIVIVALRTLASRSRGFSKFINGMLNHSLFYFVLVLLLSTMSIIWRKVQNAGWLILPTTVVEVRTWCSLDSVPRYPCSRRLDRLP